MRKHLLCNLLSIVFSISTITLSFAVNAFAEEPFQDYNAAVQSSDSDAAATDVSNIDITNLKFISKNLLMSTIDGRGNSLGNVIVDTYDATLISPDSIAELLKTPGATHMLRVESEDTGIVGNSYIETEGPDYIQIRAQRAGKTHLKLYLGDRLADEADVTVVDFPTINYTSDYRNNCRAETTSSAALLNHSKFVVDDEPISTELSSIAKKYNLDVLLVKDIYLSDEKSGEKINFDSKESSFLIQLSMTNSMKQVDASKLKVVFVSGDGSVEVEDTWISGPGGMDLNFRTSSSGLFAIVDSSNYKPADLQFSMWRLYNPYTGEHFYTASGSERDGLVAAGWESEGEGWVAPASSKTPVYRLYNPYAPGGDHHYTMSAPERDSLVAAGWRYEGVGWYSDDGMSVPLYRQYNPYAATGSHNYTASRAENDSLVAAGWRAEGVAWYGME